MTTAINDLLISVIIPTFNRCSIITDAIESVLRQTYSQYEIIVVDDGSVDTTKETVSKYGSNIKYIYQENAGPSAARNTGIRHAKGELIAFLDSDDVWREDKLARQVECFTENPRVGIVASGHDTRNENLDVINVTLLTEKEIRDIHRKDLYKNFFSTPSVMVRAKCFEDVGYFDETIRFAEDWDMWLRILRHHECSIINEPLVSVRVSSVGITSNCSEQNLQDWRKVLEKHEGDSTSAAFFTNRKRWSWFYLHMAMVYQAKNRRIAIVSLIKSIIAWPLWYPGIFYALFK